MPRRAPATSSAALQADARSADTRRVRALPCRRGAVALVLAAALALPATSSAVAEPGSPAEAGNPTDAGDQAESGSPAEPDAGQAREAAERGAREVDALMAELGDRLEAQAAARLAVAGSVSDSIAAESLADDAGARAVDARAQHSRTVRALYTSGGPVAVFSSLLDAGSLQDLADRTRVAQSLLHGAAQESGRATREHDLARGASDEGAQAADAQVVDAAAEARATDAVEDTLTRARVLLTDLDATAARAEATQEARRRAAAAAEVARSQVAEAERLVASSRAAAGPSRSAAGPSRSVPGSDIPAAFRVLYVEAAQRCPGMRWSQLAAVGQVETRHGRNNGPSSAGAQGPMQFMPRTFAAYGVDGDGDGVADPWNPSDAIHSAANYLCANGAGRGTPEAERRSLLRYNNAGWYVDLVQQAEAGILAAPG